MERAFEPVAPRAWVTLFWVHAIQMIEIAFQNKLAQEQGTVLSGLVETMQTKLVDYNNFVSFKMDLHITLLVGEG